MNTLGGVVHVLGSAEGMADGKQLCVRAEWGEGVRVVNQLAEHHHAPLDWMAENRQLTALLKALEKKNKKKRARTAAEAEASNSESPPTFVMPRPPTQPVAGPPPPLETEDVAPTVENGAAGNAEAPTAENGAAGNAEASDNETIASEDATDDA